MAEAVAERPADTAPVAAGFAGLAGPVGIAAPAEVLDWLTGFLDWPAAVPPADPAVTVERRGARFRVRGGLDPDGTRATGTAIDAANLAAAAMIESLMVGDPTLVGVHAAAAEGPGGLALLVGASGSGKSSLALHLARAGRRLFADDQILLRLDGAPRAIALGLRAKVRLPIPAAFGADFPAFVRERTVMDTPDFVALALDPALQAPFGATGRVAAIVALERLPEGPVRLEASAASATLRRLLVETIGAPDTTAGRLAALAQLCAAVPTFHLAYADSRAAAAVLAAGVPALR